MTQRRWGRGTQQGWPEGAARAGPPALLVCLGWAVGEAHGPQGPVTAGALTLGPGSSGVLAVGVGHRLDGATLPPAEAAPYSLKLTLRHSWGGGSTAARRACFPEALGTGFSAPAPAPRRHPWPGSRIRGTESSLGICVGVKPAVSPWSCLPRAGSRELLLDTALRGPWGCPSPGQVCGGRWGACLPPADACARAWGGAGAGSAGSGAAGGAGWGLWRADAAFVLFPPSVHPDRKSVPFQDALQRGRRGR